MDKQANRINNKLHVLRSPVSEVMRDFCCRAGVGTVQPVTPAPLHPAEEPALIWLCVQVTTAVGR